MGLFNSKRINLPLAFTNPHKATNRTTIIRDMFSTVLFATEFALLYILIAPEIFESIINCMFEVNTFEKLQTNIQ
jgi:hypothetical protein